MATETQETIADIIKKIRAEADYIEETARGSLKAGENYDGIAFTESDLESALDLAETKREEANRLDAAHKRERESIAPKPDPDWKDICAKCKDGDIEPKHCEYYGEPNGCNSPIYGEHPTAEKSSVVGDAAKLREALESVKRYLDGYAVNILELRRTVDAALSAPPRNCDRFASAEGAWDAYDAWVESYRAQGKTEPFNEFGWLFAPATETEGGAK